MLLWDNRILGLLTFLTRRQAWLSPVDVSRELRADGSRVSPKTVHRWFSLLREQGQFVYYPYPRANRFGLQDVLVRARGIGHPEIFSLLPFASSFAVEIGLGDTEPFVSQGYWVPGTAHSEFREFWRAARELGLVSRVDLFPSRNTHYLYSPFQQIIREDGSVDIPDGIDNRHFEMLLKAHLGEKHELRLGERIAASPLIVPIVVEHVWTHYSSRQVWDEIRAKGEKPILAYGRKEVAKMIRKPGAAIQMLHEQWRDLLDHFDEVFLQPRIALNWWSLKKCMFLSVVLRAGSLDEMVKAAMRASQLSVYVAVRSALEAEGLCHLSCFMPTDQLLPMLDLVRTSHRGLEPPFIAVQDPKATFDLFQPSYCRLDWRLFDPNELTWRFDGEVYTERLKHLL